MAKLRFLLVSLLLGCGVLLLGFSRVAAESAPSDGLTLSSQPLFDLPEAFDGVSSIDKVFLQDVSGDGKADLVLLTDPGKLIILEKAGSGFQLAFQKAWDMQRSELAVGDVDDDGRNEIIVSATRWVPDKVSRLYVLRKSENRDYETVWASPELPYTISSLDCLRLGRQTFIAAGSITEVRFFHNTKQAFEEAADRRIDLRQLVPEGYSNPAYPDFPVFGPGIGLVTGFVSFDLPSGESRLALTARDYVSDTGGGALVILRWKKSWQVEQVLPIKRYPESLAAGSFLPGNAPSLLVKTADNADMENLILFGRRNGQWTECWRTGPQREDESRLRTAGFSFTDKGKLLAVAANHFAGENNFQGAKVTLYQWQNDGMKTSAQLAFSKPLLALIPVPDKKQTRFIVIQAGGLGQELTFVKP